jgi:hypothetical protein
VKRSVRRRWRRGGIVECRSGSSGVIDAGEEGRDVLDVAWTVSGAAVDDGGSLDQMLHGTLGAVHRSRPNIRRCA